MRWKRQTMSRVRMMVLYSGRVQGVGFRYATRSVAAGFDVTGTVRNLADGRVELVACGEEAQVKQLEKWLWQGPRHARVEQVAVQETGTESFAGFSVRG